MDLRKFRLSQAQVEQGTACLNYQPFILDDDICTGVAYSWIGTSDGGRSQNARDFVLDRRKCDGRLWERFWDANRRLASMYDDFLDAIVKHVPQGTLLDVACNNGYFLVRGMERGMSQCVGYDLVDYSASVAFLNSVVGTKAKFHNAGYDSWTHEIAGCDEYDVVVATNIMQHVSDPLYFLNFLGRRARKALFLFHGVGDTDEYLVYYAPPNRFYSEKDRPFPVGFDNHVTLSRGLLWESLKQLGFTNIIEIPRRDTWLPNSFLDQGCQRALLCLR
jgi:SAM-dependent methyltransferase